MGKKLNKLKCFKCGSEKTATTGFYASNSELFQYNQKRIPYCKDCLNSIYEDTLNRNNYKLKAIYDFCIKFDIYFHLNTANRCIEDNISYIQKINSMPQFKSRRASDSDSLDIIKETASNTEVSNEIKNKWGQGYSNNEYIQLERLYDEWMSHSDVTTLTLSAKKLIKEMCVLEVEQNRARIEKKDKKFKDISELLSKKMGDANIKPAQQKGLGEADDDIFGMKLAIYEREEPVPKVLPEYEDIDGFWKYLVKNMIKPFAMALGLASGEYSIEEGSDNIKLGDEISEALEENSNEQ